MDIYTLLCVRQISSGKLLYSTGSSALCSVMNYRGRREVYKRRDICIHVADSLPCAAETNATL